VYVVLVSLVLVCGVCCVVLFDVGCSCAGCAGVVCAVLLVLSVLLLVFAWLFRCVRVLRGAVCLLCYVLRLLVLNV